MFDQASKLRNLASAKNPAFRQSMRTIAVASGKGGVGKTNLVVNLALALVDHNYRVIIMDGDVSLANVDIAFGITPRYSLRHLLFEEKRIEEILYPVEKGIMVLPGASGVSELANLDRGQLRNVLANLGRLEKIADILLIDTGAGIGSNVLSFIGAADDVIIVVTPEPPSITDSYGLIKAFSQLSEASNIHVVVNRVKNKTEALEIFTRLEHAVRRFLGLEPKLLGWIYDDPQVGRSVMQQKPLGLINPRSQAYKCIQWIAGNVAGIYLEPPTESGGIRRFVSSFLRQ
ncbi:MAG: MinD/ParA family protein [Peptococcaceae bacterium]|jgi:flagellar biosynthesis protein FlhG|nr:MinD/ParA family protein [Peptococcaceae bacterium]